jgi:hypothetical protein
VLYRNATHAVTLKDWSFSFEETKLNYASFSLSFVEASEKPYPTNAIGGARSPGNTSVTIDNFLTKIRKIYKSIDATFGQVLHGITAAKAFINNASVMSLLPSSFGTVLALLRGFDPSRDKDANFDSTEAVYEAAIKPDPVTLQPAPVAFFRRASELRLTGQPGEEAQTHMAALVGLAYYFERLSESPVSFADLAEFRERAISLKSAEPLASDAIDSLIVALGGLAGAQCSTAALSGSHALVASYRLFGNISKAYDITDLSRGVAGAQLVQVVHPCVDA